jgi:putative transposase
VPLLASDRLIQKKLRLDFVPVQLFIAAMSTTDRRSATLRLNVKVVFILIYRKDTVICQSQNIQKMLSPLQGLPHEFFCGKENLVLKMWSFPTSFLHSYQGPKGDSTHISDVDLLCTDVNNDEIPRTFPNSRINHTNYVWSSDITYIRLAKGFVYLVAILDWFSRYVLSWELSITLDTSFCLEALEKAFQSTTPVIFNTDQGVQFTSQEYIQRLKAANVRISWDGRGRALDNIFVERLWRSVKYEEVFIKDYRTVLDTRSGLQEYFQFYNHERLHQALDYQTPAQVYLR